MRSRIARKVPLLQVCAAVPLPRIPARKEVGDDGVGRREALPQGRVVAGGLQAGHFRDGRVGDIALKSGPGAQVREGWVEVGDGQPVEDVARRVLVPRDGGAMGEVSVCKGDEDWCAEDAAEEVFPDREERLHSLDVMERDISLSGSVSGTTARMVTP